jgi:hypothetical protein
MMGIGRWGLVVVGLLVDLVGIVWILQGINVLPGSFMTGQMFWTWMGIGMVVIGTALVVLAVRRTATPPASRMR